MAAAIARRSADPDLFDLVTWDDLDLYYGHKAQ